jgi:hypothetical protein
MKVVNMKKFVKFVLLGMLIVFFAGCTTSEDKASSKKEITVFSINGIEGTIDKTDKTIAIAGMPYDTDVTELVATYTTNGHSVKVGTTEQTSSETSNDFTNPVIYTVTADDHSTQDYVVTVTLAPSPLKSITSFSLDESAGTINETDKTIAVNLPAGTDVTALIATFTTTGVSVKVGETFQASGQTTNDFTNPVVYTVTAADSTTKDYAVTVTVPVVNRPATAITVSMKPNNSANTTNPNVLCVNTLRLTGSEVVTDPDGETVLVRQWYVNGVLKASGTNVFPGPFVHLDSITYKVTADGVVSNSVSAQVA